MRHVDGANGLFPRFDAFDKVTLVQLGNIEVDVGGLHPNSSQVDIAGFCMNAGVNPATFGAVECDPVFMFTSIHHMDFTSVGVGKFQIIIKDGVE